MQESEKAEEEFKIPLSDFAKTIKKKRRPIILGSIAFACLIGGYSLSKPPRYKSEGSFKEKSINSSSMNQGGVTSLVFTGLNPDTSSEAKSMMNSKKILREVALKENLQAELFEASENSGLLNRIKKNLLLEYSYLVKLQSHPFIEKATSIQVSDIEFTGDFPLSLSIVPDSENVYTVYDSKGKKMGTGKIGAPFAAEGLSFTLSRVKPDTVEGKTYTLKLFPLNDLITSLAKDFKVTSDKEDSTLLKISYSNKNKERSSSLINTLMFSYQDYLRKEEQRTSSEQIAYLNKREEEMGKKLKLTFDTYASKLSSELSTMGYADSEKALNFFAQQLHHLRERMLKIDLTHKILTEVLSKDADVQIDTYFQADSNPTFMNKIIEQVFKLKQESDTLKFAIEENVDQDKNTLHAALQNPIAALDAPTLEEEHTDQNLAHSEFRGVNVEIGAELLVAYIKDHSEIQAKILQYEFLIHELENPEFEISTLSSVFTDPVIKELTEKAGRILVGLQDDVNRSQKEKERMKADLQFQRNFLLLHLKQTIDLLKVELDLFKEKILALQNMNFQLIKQQTSILEKQLSNSIKTHLQSLMEERKLLTDYENQLKKEMSTLPNKWANEKIIEQQVKMHAAMVEEIAKLVESKNITSNLEMIRSAPVDLAVPPVRAQYPFILVYTILGSLLGAFLTAGAYITRNLFRGFPLSKENLQTSGLHVAGYITKDKKENFKTLKRLVSFLCHTRNFGTSLLFINPTSEDLAQQAGQLIQKNGYRVVLVLERNSKSGSHSDSDQEVSSNDSIDGFQLLKDTHFDTVYLNSSDENFLGLPYIKRFQDLVCTLKKEYDWVICSIQNKIENDEIDILIPHFDSAALTLSQQPITALNHLIQTLKTEDKVRFTSFLILEDT